MEAFVDAGRSPLGRQHHDLDHGVREELLRLGLVWPVINHLTGTTEDLSEYANLQGNLGMLAGLLLITWTVAAFGEELVYRGFIQTRVTDVLGAKLVGVVVAVVFTSQSRPAAPARRQASTRRARTVRRTPRSRA